MAKWYTNIGVGSIFFVSLIFDIDKPPNSLERSEMRGQIDLNLFAFPLEVIATLSKAWEAPNRYSWTPSKKFPPPLNLSYDGGFTDLSFKTLGGGGGSKCPLPYFYF